MPISLIKIPYLRLKYRYFPNKAQAFWGQELLNSQGISAKIGQILAQGKESQLPKSSLKPQDAQRIFFENFNEKILIEGEALAASMGQVFTIKVDDQTFALKILHPGIKKKLQKEIGNLLLLGRYFAKAKGFSFNVPTFKRFLVEVFEEETDLKREALFQLKFFNLFAGNLKFKIPKIIPHYSNENILCQEWVPAFLARDLKRFPSFSIFEFFFQSLLQEGVLHGDLNDRNWGYNAQDQVVIYDYGCTQIISERRINGLKKLILNQDIKEAFKEFGVRLEATWFKGKEQELRDALFDPFIKSQVKADWSYSQDLEARFGDKIKALREFTDPWVLLMMRSLFSLIRIHQERKISIPLRELVNPYLMIKNEFESKVQVHIEITENQKQVFYFALPYSSLEIIKGYIPQKTQEKIQEEGLKLEDILINALKKGPVAQDIFAVQIENRRHRVWVS